MRRLIHLVLSPSCRLARLMVGEKRVACDPVIAEDFKQSMPVFVDMDGTRAEGVWAILDHLEHNYPDYPLAPADDAARRACLRWVDWAFGPFHEQVTQRIVYEKGAPRHTGAGFSRPPDMNAIRAGREELKSALKAIGTAAETNGNLACRETTLGDLAVAAHLSSLDYFGEVPWADFPAANEWYVRMKSRPAFRSILLDRVPGQPPVSHYAELDF
ncbi:MAG TPA: glutathione S-transferase family protein [Rhizomicrobium sp.]|nr:glutathione S-transferase family protein [Rhizomicrobium sp.]